MATMGIAGPTQYVVKEGFIYNDQHIQYTGYIMHKWIWKINQIVTQGVAVYSILLLQLHFCTISIHA